MGVDFDTATRGITSPTRSDEHATEEHQNSTEAESHRSAFVDEDERIEQHGRKRRGFLCGEGGFDDRHQVERDVHEHQTKHDYPEPDDEHHEWKGKTGRCRSTPVAHIGANGQSNLKDQSDLRLTNLFAPLAQRIERYEPMASLERALNQRRRRSPLVYIGASAFVGGLLFVAVGTFALVRDLLVPVTSTPWSLAVILTGVVLPALLYTASYVLDDSDTGRMGGTGLLAALAGVSVFALLTGLGVKIGTTVVLATAALPYAIGLSLLVVTFFSVAIDRHLDVTSVYHSPTKTSSRTRRDLAGPVTADGGDDEDDLDFLLEDEDDQNT